MSAGKHVHIGRVNGFERFIKFHNIGAHLEKGLNRFQKMSVTHPRQHAIVMDRMGMREAMEMISVKVDYDDN